MALGRVEQKKTHLDEIDYLRAFFLGAVVTIHGLGYFLEIPLSDPVGRSLQELGVNLLRFARQGFMFVTGVVLFYSYRGRRLETGGFFRRRLRNLVLPYMVWTAVYLLVKESSGMVDFRGLGEFALLWGCNVLSGEGFYHLYYIVVAIQFYFLFPLLLRIRLRDPARLAKIVIALGLVLCGIYHYALEVGGAVTMAWASGTAFEGVLRWLAFWKDRLLLSYLPYYLLGGLAGTYLEQWREWVMKNGGAIKRCAVALMGVLVLEYVVFRVIMGGSWAHTISVFKPSIYLYSFAVIAWVYRIGLKAAGGFRPRVSEADGSSPSVTAGVIRSLAANSLGIYLVHPAVYYFTHTHLVQVTRAPWPILCVTDVAFVLVLSWAISVTLSFFPHTGFIVGEAGDLSRSTFIHSIRSMAVSWMRGR